MAVTVLDDTNFEEEIAKAGNAIVDYYAAWCGPCIMFKPKFKRISADYPHVAFFMLDGNKAPNARQAVKIDELPYFGVFRDGKLVDGRSMSEEAPFRAFVEAHFGKPEAS